MRYYLGVFLLALLHPISGKGQQLRDSISAVMVTASRIPSGVKTTGKSVTVLTSKDIRSTTATTVDELLANLPGLNINFRNGFGVQADIGMRASTFSQVLVMVDNVRINDPLTAHFNSNIPIALAEIGQIEIIRGPASASFGSDAVGGVIHIKTKSYLRRYEHRELTITGEAGTGANRQTTSNIGAFYQEGKLILSGGVQTNIASGETLVNPNFTHGISDDSLYYNHFDLRTYSASVVCLFSHRWNLYLRANTTQRAFNAKYFYTRSLYDESEEETNSRGIQASIRHHSERQETEILLSQRNTDDLFTFNPLFPANRHHTQQRILNITHNFDGASRLKLAIGAQAIHQKISSTDRGDHQKTNGGIFSTLSYPILPNLVPTVSIRLAVDPAYGAKVLPQMDWAYAYKKWIIRSSTGMAMRSADFTEQYISSQIPMLSPGRNIGNPDLKPEQSFSADLGLDWNPSNDFSLSSSVFFRQSKNLIDYILTNANDIKNATNLQPDETYLYANNISESLTIGMEFSARKNYTFDHSQIKLEGNYTYLQTSTPNGIVSKYIANHPRHVANAKADLYLPNLSLTTTLQYQQRAEAFAEQIRGHVPKEVFLLHAKLSIHTTDDRFSFYLRVNNITDADYQFILGAPMPGRWWMLGMRWSLYQ